MCCFNLCFPLHIEVVRREHLCQKQEDAEPCERETVSEERSVGGAEVNPGPVTERTFTTAAPLPPLPPDAAEQNLNVKGRIRVRLYHKAFQQGLIEKDQVPEPQLFAAMGFALRYWSVLREGDLTRLRLDGLQHKLEDVLATVLLKFGAAMACCRDTDVLTPALLRNNSVKKAVLILEPTMMMMVFNDPSSALDVD